MIAYRALAATGTTERDAAVEMPIGESEQSSSLAARRVNLEVQITPVMLAGKIHFPS
jgi:hypothetical protein